MSEDTLLDRLRARAEGRLPAAELRRLERELREDPRLLELADDFDAVHALTGAGEAPIPACRVRFEGLAPRLAPVRRAPRRRVAAAAGILVLAGVAALVWTGERAGAVPLVLSAIDLEPLEDRDEPAPPPALSADFDPRGDGAVRWIADMQAAVWLSGAAGRPLLVYGTFDGCPLCAVLDERVFRDPRVVDLFERYVPVRIDFGALPAEKAEALIARGYPFLEVWDAAQESCFQLPNVPDPLYFVEGMHDGLEAAGAVGELPSWDSVRALSGLFAAAQRGEEAGSMAEAVEGFRALALRAPGGVFAELAEYGLRRIGGDARERLLAAQRAADPKDARRLLEVAARRFAGTVWGDDLRAVLERLERDGRFPDIVTPLS